MEKTISCTIVTERVFGHFLGVWCSFHKPETNLRANSLFPEIILSENAGGS
jgi:hypothetical protein